MKVYVFGNPDHSQDNKVFKIVNELKESLSDIEFITVNPNEDLPFVNEEGVVLIDVIDGIDEVKVFGGEDLDKLVLPPRASVHDFDLGFQLKYLKKLGRLGNVTIVGIPMKENVESSLVRLILLRMLQK